MAFTEQLPVTHLRVEAGLTPETIKRFALGLAVFLSLLAAVFALTRVGGEYLSAIVAGLAVLVSFIAVAVALSARERFVYLGSAGTAVFLAISALMFSIGSIVAMHKIDEARDYIDKAVPIKEDHAKAKQERVQAQAARDEKLAGPQRLLNEANAKTEALKGKEAKLVTEQGALKEAQATLDADKAKLQEDQVKFADDKRALEKKQFDLTDREMALQREEQVLMKKAEKLQADLQLPQQMKKAAEELSAKAENALKEAEKKQNEAKAELQDAKDHYGKIKAIFDKLPGQLKTQQSEGGKKKVIDAIRQIGEPPTSANVDLSEINHDLCEIVASQNLRPDALSALQAIKPDFGSLVGSLTKGMVFKRPMEKKLQKEYEKEYLDGVKSLPTFGHAGLPLKDWLLANSGYSDDVRKETNLQQGCDLLIREFSGIKEYLTLKHSVDNLKVKNSETYRLTREQIDAMIARHPKTKIADEAKKLKMRLKK